MEIFEHQTELFQTSGVGTECLSFRLLRENPLRARVSYCAVPWTILINTNQLKSVALPKLQNSFTICEHIRYREILPILRKAGIKTLFAPHVSARHFFLRVEPYPLKAHHFSEAEGVRDLLYSFIGYDSTTQIKNRLRRRLFDGNHPADTIVKERNQWHWAGQMGWGDLDAELQEQEKTEYIEVLGRSRFSLCPRGSGPNTIRFWESLAAGAIPVVLADAFRLPDGVDWDKCIVRIRESKVHSVVDTLEKIAPGRELEMRKLCVSAFHQFADENFVSPVRRRFDTA